MWFKWRPVWTVAALLGLSLLVALLAAFSLLSQVVGAVVGLASLAAAALQIWKTWPEAWGTVQHAFRPKVRYRYGTALVHTNAGPDPIVEAILPKETQTEVVELGVRLRFPTRVTDARLFDEWGRQLAIGKATSASVSCITFELAEPVRDQSVTVKVRGERGYFADIVWPLPSASRVYQPPHWRDLEDRLPDDQARGDGGVLLRGETGVQGSGALHVCRHLPLGCADGLTVRAPVVPQDESVLVRMTCGPVTVSVGPGYDWAISDASDPGSRVSPQLAGLPPLPMGLRPEEEMEFVVEVTRSAISLSAGVLQVASVARSGDPRIEGPLTIEAVNGAAEVRRIAILPADRDRPSPAVLVPPPAVAGAQALTIRGVEHEGGAHWDPSPGAALESDCRITLSLPDGLTAGRHPPQLAAYINGRLLPEHLIGAKDNLVSLALPPDLPPDIYTIQLAAVRNKENLWTAWAAYRVAHTARRAPRDGAPTTAAADGRSLTSHVRMPLPGHIEVSATLGDGGGELTLQVGRAYWFRVVAKEGEGSVAHGGGLVGGDGETTWGSEGFIRPSRNDRHMSIQVSCEHDSLSVDLWCGPTRLAALQASRPSRLSEPCGPIACMTSGAFSAGDLALRVEPIMPDVWDLAQLHEAAQRGPIERRTGRIDRSAAG